MKNKILLLFRLSIFLGAAYGSFEQMGVFDGRFNGQQLLYYTILSNIIITLYYLIFYGKHFIKIFSNHKTSIPHPGTNITGALTMMIFATGIIYHIVLVPNLSDLSSYGNHYFSNFLVHTYVPFAVSIDWLFVKIVEKNIKPVKWLLIPLGYWIIALLYASFNIPLFQTKSNYAYFFIDADKLGWEKTILNVILLSIFFLILGYTLKGVKLLQVYFQNRIKK